MPSNETAKTKWALKHRAWIVLLSAVLILLACIATSTLLKDEPRPARPGHNAYTLTIQGTPTEYKLIPAKTVEEQEQGLSDTSELGDHAGMLFINNEVAERCFWMKDMRYPLDIVWVDAAKKVVHVKANVSPDTYPQTFCANAQYIIELNAGEAAQSGISKGRDLSF